MAQQDQTMDLLMLVYGSSVEDPADDHIRFCGAGQRRVEIQFRPLIPPNIVGNMRRLHSWTQSLVSGLMLDAKHSQRWHCVFCTKLARETHVSLGGWPHLNPPKMNAYVHLVCDTVRGECAKLLKGVSQDFAMLSGGGPPRTPGPEDIFTGKKLYPAAASCLTCHKEETIHKTSFRCSRCKLTRYCSADCQKQDWNRHKEHCKMVKEVNWVWK